LSDHVKHCAQLVTVTSSDTCTICFITGNIHTDAY